jgi:hypothetical protein
MNALQTLIATVLALTAVPAPAAVYWDDHPGVGFDPNSTAEAPCGTGTPPRGHFAQTVDADTPGGVLLTVKQDPNRLCYVANGIAEAPVIRVRQGDPHGDDPQRDHRSGGDRQFRLAGDS